MGSTKRLLLSIFLLVGLAAAACGGAKDETSPTSDGGTVTEVQLTQACERFTRATAERAKRCSQVEVDPAEDTQGGIENCKRYYRLPGVNSTPQAVEACAAALETGACGVELEACKVEAGSLDNNAVCEGSEQCKGGLCRIDIGGTTFGKCGVCEARHADGTACSEESLYDPCEVGSTCEGGTCKKSLPLGATCVFPEGPTCARSTCVNGTCQERRAVGGACTRNGECAFGLACVDKTCRNPAYKPPGSNCDLAGDRCSKGFCYVAEGVDGGDGPPPVCPRLLALGDPCNFDDGSTTCPEYSGCYSGRCTLDWGDPVCK
jgi:hypothetical protein